MVRANRYILDGYVYHLTARCHDKKFLLGFVRDREEYWRRLRSALPLFDVSLLGYCITSNHVHLLATAGSRDDLAGFMQKVQGEHAESYNGRKGRTGAFWTDRYHATMVESGRHLWNCMVYIDLNMLRAGVVKHPSEWRWSGYHELIGQGFRGHSPIMP
jgi:putative transposase